MNPNVKGENEKSDIPENNLQRDKFYGTRNSDRPRSSKFRGTFLPATDQPYATSDSANYCLTRTEGKTALFYEDTVSGRSFRFILHRKNARKADIYACAKCKSRRKYVRIMVQNDKFLCDPASLDHICYMTPAELYNERVNNEKQKQRKMKQLMAEIPLAGESLVGGAGSPEYASAEGQELVYADSLFESPKPILAENVRAEGSLSVTPSCEVVTDVDSINENYQESSCDAVNGDKERQKMPQTGEEPQASEQEPHETKCSQSFNDEPCLQTIKMALASLPSHTRQKAYVDILRYVYTTIFDKYLKNHSDQ